MALTDSDKGKMAADVCIVLILIVAAFAGGLLVSSGGIPEGFPFIPNTNTNTNNTNTGTDTTTTTTNTDTTTTTTTTLPDPPPTTRYKIYIVLRFTGGETFNEHTEGIAVLQHINGDQDARWTIVAQAGANNMTGASDSPRHTKDSTIGKTLLIVVADRGWNYESTIGSNWARTPDGIGDYFQSFSLGSNLELQVWLSPRWDGS